MLLALDLCLLALLCQASSLGLLFSQAVLPAADARIAQQIGQTQQYTKMAKRRIVDVRARTRASAPKPSPAVLGPILKALRAL